MKLQKLRIKNFKSIVDLELVNPSPFSVFVGPNGAGKSNIFEALEYLSYSYNFRHGNNAISDRLFDLESTLHFNYVENPQLIVFETDNIPIFRARGRVGSTLQEISQPYQEQLNRLRRHASDREESFDYSDAFSFLWDFSRIFVSNISLEKLKITSDETLSLAAGNLEKVLYRILNEKNKAEMFEWLDLFLPGFENLEIASESLSGNYTLQLKQKFIDKKFSRNLISDGTFNILALLTAVFQSDEPQFLCIEEPENGLNPRVIRELVEFFRISCEEKGHYIWLNTHSQTLVSQLKEEELIIVDKKKGSTQIKQFKKGDFYGLRADEAWLTNVLGGGLPW